MSSSPTAMIPVSVPPDPAPHGLRARHHTALRHHWDARERATALTRLVQGLTALDAALDATMTAGSLAPIPELDGAAGVASPLGRGLLSAVTVHVAAGEFLAGNPAPLVMVRGAVRECRDQLDGAARVADERAQRWRARVEELAAQARVAGVTVSWQ